MLNTSLLQSVKAMPHAKLVLAENSGRAPHLEASEMLSAAGL